MNNWIIIGIVAGGISAACFGGVAILPPLLAFVVFYLASLPLFLAGLGWGAVCAGLGAVAGGSLVAVLGGVKLAALFIAVNGLVPVLISHFALKSRHIGTEQGAEGEINENGIEWYPEGRLVLWIAGSAAAIVIGTVVLLGPDAKSFVGVLEKAIEPFIQAQLQAAPTPEHATYVKTYGEAGIRLFPIIAPMVWVLVFLVNFGLAVKFISASGYGRRPWNSFGYLQFPKSSGLLLTAAALLAFVPGTLGYFGMILGGAVFTVFAVLGLAVLHGLLLGHPLRGVLLSALYLSLALLNVILIIPLIFTALLDMILGMRRKIFTNSGGTGGS